VGGNYLPKKPGKVYKVGHNICKCSNVYTTTCYFIHKRFIKRVLDIVEEDNFMSAVDEVYVKLQSKSNMYIFSPRLIYQRADYSDIVSDFRDYTQMKDFYTPADMLNCKRFDIAAKCLYANHYIKDTKINFPKELYLEHLRVLNNLYEETPKKVGGDAFLTSFHDIINSINKNGFDGDVSKIPIDNGSIINGAHRIASCITLNKGITTTPGTVGQRVCDYNYLRTKTNFVKTGLLPVYSDEMALEFCRRKDNLYTITLFPGHTLGYARLFNIINKKCNVVCDKDIVLSNTGKLNFIHNIYYGEGWTGTKNTRFHGVRSKLKPCFKHGNSVKVILVEQSNVQILKDLKQEVRSICKIGNHSIHINDTQEETWRISSSVFNGNSIHMLNHRRIHPSPSFDQYFEKYVNIVSNRLDSEDFCIDSSAVMSAYGIRDCRDIDFLHLSNYVSPIGTNIDCHNKESHHYSDPKNEIIYNPTLHFYLHGIKFASLDVVRSMKSTRGEDKDIIDVNLINTIL